MTVKIQMKINRKPTAAFLANYKVALAKLQASQQPAKLKTIEQIEKEGIKIQVILPLVETAPAPADSEGEPSEHPLASRWAIKGMRLAPGRSRYFIVLPAPYFATLRECGTPMQTTRHILECYKIAEDAKTVADAIEGNTPFATVFTTPFIFHSETSACLAIEETLRVIAEDLI